MQDLLGGGRLLLPGVLDLRVCAEIRGLFREWDSGMNKVNFADIRGLPRAVSGNWVSGNSLYEALDGLAPE